MQTAIVTDSTCDLPRELLEQYGITVLPLHITKGGQSLLDCIEITPEDIFAHVAAGGEICAVAALGANLLHLKPCIEVQNGKMAVGRKYRGSLEKVMAQYVQDRLAACGPGDMGDMVIIVHPPADEAPLAAGSWRRTAGSPGSGRHIPAAPWPATAAPTPSASCSCGGRALRQEDVIQNETKNRNRGCRRRYAGDLCRGRVRLLHGCGHTV